MARLFRVIDGFKRYQCSRCTNFYLPTSFGFQRGTLRSWCKHCERERNGVNYEARKEREATAALLSATSEQRAQAAFNRLPAPRGTAVLQGARA